ncbi:hepatoma-derived growth factor, isoform CRA_b [Rattus norvegicus]|uniref:Hepatoma-derived growth factor, isoform CRA_b n=1 Tax=Rattus norvegicus TaxID=10116 RepID=A6J629_RAT|nr:hepatoma-derived growth factor, isoform CRA_b [Rattus norvegicus]
MSPRHKGKDTFFKEMFLIKENYPKKKPTKKKKRKKLTCPFVCSLFCSFLPTTDPFVRCTRGLALFFGAGALMFPRLGLWCVTHPIRSPLRIQGNVSSSLLVVSSAPLPSLVFYSHPSSGL